MKDSLWPGASILKTHVAPLIRMRGAFSEIALDFVMKDGGKLPVFVNATELKNSEGQTTLTRVIVLKGN